MLPLQFWDSNTWGCTRFCYRYQIVKDIYLFCVVSWHFGGRESCLKIKFLFPYKRKGHIKSLIKYILTVIHMCVTCIHMSVLRYPCLTVCVCTLSPFPWYIHVSLSVHAHSLGIMHSHVSVKISMSHCLCMHTLSLSLVPCIHMSVLRYPCLTVCVCTLSPFPWYHAFTCQC